MEKFLLIAEPRSGTTFFNSVLARHPEISPLGEILPGTKKQTHFHRYWLKRIGKDADAILLSGVKRVFDDFLAEMERQARGKSALGVDIKYYQMEWKPDLLEVLRARGYKAIHMVRGNLVRRHVSRTLHKPEVRERLNRPNHTSALQPPVRLTLETGPELLTILANMQANIERWRAILASSFPTLELMYEEILAPEINSLNRACLDSVYEFLGVSDREPALGSSLRKMNPTLLRHSLANYHEVAATLGGTEFERMLDDPAYDLAHLDAFVALARAEGALLKGAHAEAVAGFMAAREAAPELPEPLFGLALTRLAMGLAQKAAEPLAAAFEQARGTDAEIYFKTVLGTLALDQKTQAALGSEVAGLFPEPDAQGANS